uniref:Rad50/SbcC-type AAA domain-containing protein n=1 Tax=Chromera velia CCMP2878 TaxID=1169474 RepID=A0A0G4FR63_9ALVE|eukprot:Cvel_18329.t1-p1 / transcript=Cvel_18329.t1 / gene=Cvel_18329 / organism=Chromera_velia_CCMP2878 / gene_product=DNA repair protein RAD50, putative / transcript_product=DNA repair protein RAD50, putative / location=Cvel_scaffold1513:4362-18938(-) / protein_length=1396 / sequence_SO=supercontig / SO=protein_coding / is_pseudo=false
MSCVQKLAIRGIRSFSHEREEVLKFERPLTLIVGENGAGKTTVIECLRMATTGQLPPNCGKGAPFIHDPKLENLPEIKAQIKLLFLSAAGKRVCAMRSLQLTHTVDKHGKAKATFKSLETALQVQKADGGQATLSQRCADVDAHMPQLMGVPKAVLDSVVFCHQEDSAWPMGDMGQLKKKFDELFGATRYTKALQEIQAQSKEQAKQMKECKAAKELLTSHLEQANRMRTDIARWDGTKWEVEEQLKDIEPRLEAADKAIAEAEEALEGVSNFSGQLEAQKTLKKKANQRARGLMDQLGEDETMAESLEQLTAALEEVETSDLPGLDARLRSLAEALAENESQRRESAEDVREARKEAGALAGAADRLQSDRSTRDRKVSELRAAGVEFRGSTSRGGASADDTARAALEAVSRLVSSKQRALGQLREEGARAEEAAEKQCEQEEAKVSSLSAAVATSAARAAEARRAAAADEAELAKNAASSDQAQERRCTVESLESQLRKQESSGVIEKAAEEIQSLSGRRERVAVKLRKATDSVKELEALTSQLTEVDFLRRHVAAAESKLSERAEGVSASLLRHLSSSVPPPLRNLEDIKKAEASVVSEQKKARTELGRQRERVQNSSKAFLEAEAQFSREEKAVAERLEKAKSLEARVREALTDIGGELDVPPPSSSSSSPSSSSSSSSAMRALLEVYNEDWLADRLETARTRARSAQGNMDAAAKLKTWVESLSSKAERQHRCYFCMRNFKDAAEVDKFRSQMKTITGRFDEFDGHKGRTEELQQDLEALEKLEPTLRALVDAVEEAELAQGEAKNDERDESLKALREEKSAAEKGLEEAETAFRGMDAALRSLSDLKEMMTSTEADSKNLKEKEKNLQGLIGGGRGGGGSSTEDLRGRLARERQTVSDCHSEMEEIEKLQGKARASRAEAEREISSLRTSLAEERARLSVLQQAIERKKEVEGRLKTRRQEEREAAEAERDARRKLDEQKERSERKKADRRKLSQKNKAKVEEAEGDVKALERLAEETQTLHKGIEDLEKKVAASDKLRKRLSEAESKLAEKEREVEDLRAQETRTRAEKEGFEKELKTIRVNLQIREAEADAAGYQKKIDEIVRQMGATDVDEFKRRVEEKRKKREAINQQKHEAKGKLQSCKEFVEKVKKDLKHPQYSGIDKRHAEAVLNYETAEMAHRDLARYHTALDKALMRFHSMKMQQINRSVRELWGATYKGRDIDYVAVRSDTDGDADAQGDGAGGRGGSGAVAAVPSSGGAGTRSYNYRVVMCRGRVEMEMRGRCSAGQKVLASIVIRMALAESFGVNCGILALDEPTTNLDRRNIEGLANSLGELISSRRVSSHFQLILITHDEEFVRLLGRHQLCDRFLRIRKDDRGCSKVETADIRSF